MRVISATDVSGFNMLPWSMALISFDTRHVVLMGDDIRVTMNARWSPRVCKRNSTVSYR
jgi:hypothetical protein